MANGEQEGAGRVVVYAGVGVALVAAVAIALWATRDLSGPPAAELAREQAERSAPPAPAPTPTPAAEPAAPALAPAVGIPDKGRITVSAEDLREGDVLALGLSLPDDVRGEGAHAVRIVDVSGRVLDLEARPVTGSGTGLRLEIDPAWLRPGRYLISVQTADRHPLSGRRYVLEVAPSPPS